MDSFALGSRVVISGLSKAAEYNGCIAIVVSDLLPSGRHTVSLIENKKISVKPGNLKYEPMKIETLSVKQLKAVLEGTGQELIAGSEAGHLRDQLSGMDVDLVAQSFAKINLSSSSEEVYTFANGMCAHCISSSAAYQVHCHQISLLCQEVAKQVCTEWNLLCSCLHFGRNNPIFWAKTRLPSLTPWLQIGCSKRITTWPVSPLSNNH